MKTVESITGALQIDVHDSDDSDTINLNIIGTMFGVHATFDRLDLLSALGATDAKQLAELVRKTAENTRQADELRTRIPELVRDAERLREEVEEYRQAAEAEAQGLNEWQKRAEALEATVERVRKLHRETVSGDNEYIHTRDLRNALSEPFDLPTKAGVRFEATRVNSLQTKTFVTLEGADVPYYKMEGWGGGFIDAEGITDYYMDHRLLGDDE